MFKFTEFPPVPGKVELDRDFMRINEITDEQAGKALAGIVFAHCDMSDIEYAARINTAVLDDYYGQRESGRQDFNTGFFSVVETERLGVTV